MTHHPRYGGNTLARLLTNFRGRLCGRLTVASEQFLFPTSCRLGYRLFVSGIYKIKTLSWMITDKNMCFRVIQKLSTYLVDNVLKRDFRVSDNEWRSDGPARS